MTEFTDVWAGPKSSKLEFLKAKRLQLVLGTDYIGRPLHPDAINRLLLENAAEIAAEEAKI